MSHNRDVYPKFYNLAEVGVEVGGRVLFRRNPYHFKDKNCVEVRLAGRIVMMLGHVAAEVTLTIVAETPQHIWVNTICHAIEHHFSSLLRACISLMLSTCSCTITSADVYAQVPVCTLCIW